MLHLYIVESWKYEISKSAGVSGQFCLSDHMVEVPVMECLKEL